MLIAIDHGNKNMKTAHKVFTSGLTESDTRPPFGDNILEYGGKYYTLSEQRIPYMRDKTADDRFFVLTLFAVAFEVEAAELYSADDILDIQLAVGLPPLHYGSQYKKFEAYFSKREIVDFTMNDRPYSIFIDKARCYPQAYAAALSSRQMREQKKILVVDIGGFTIDYVRIQDGRPDFAVCDSLENGVITLYNDIIRKVNGDLDLLLQESDIDAILRGEDTDYPEQAAQIIHGKAAAFVDDLAGKLRERMIDLRVGRNVFIGGGAVLLRRYIEDSEKIGGAFFITDIAANVRGYALLYSASKGR